MDKRRIQVLISFEVEGDHTDAMIDDLVTQAVIQIEDPRDMDGDRVYFRTRIIGSEWETAGEGGE